MWILQSTSLSVLVERGPCAGQHVRFLYMLHRYYYVTQNMILQAASCCSGVYHHVRLDSELKSGKHLPPCIPRNLIDDGLVLISDLRKPYARKFRLFSISTIQRLPGEDTGWDDRSQIPWPMRSSPWYGSPLISKCKHENTVNETRLQHSLESKINGLHIIQ